MISFLTNYVDKHLERVALSVMANKRKEKEKKSLTQKRNIQIVKYYIMNKKTTKIFIVLLVTECMTFFYILPYVLTHMRVNTCFFFHSIK